MYDLLILSLRLALAFSISASETPLREARVWTAQLMMSLTWEADPANFIPNNPESEKLAEKLWASLMKTLLARILL